MKLSAKSKKFFSSLAAAYKDERGKLCLAWREADSLPSLSSLGKLLVPQSWRDRRCEGLIRIQL